MKKMIVFSVLLMLLGSASLVNATVIDFTGGTAYRADGTVLGTTNNSALFNGNVGYYIEDGFKYTFYDAAGNIYNGGIIGNYYATGSRPAGSSLNNDVIHAHWSSGGIAKMTITAVDGSAFDLNYIDLTSNTTYGGGAATGTEKSYITNNNGYSMLLPSSDWGFDYDYWGATGDGVARLYLDGNFDAVTMVAFTSQNAYCFGMDNFYINEPAPPSVPEPATMLLFGSGLAGIVALRRRMKS